MKTHSAGFTLIEIAIVLVVIGLLLGGVLKGQELINSAKVKNFANDFRNIPVFLYGYQDKYKALPGDQRQTTLDGQFPPAGTATACAPNETSGPCVQGNGVLNGTWNAGGITDESFVFWQHVRLANLAAGTTDLADPAYLPRNADGGIIGIQSAAEPYIQGMGGTYLICSSAIPGNSVKPLDTAMDDGNTATGSMRAVPTGSAANTAATATQRIKDGQSYTVCLSF